jgi:hypothetical protein
MVKRVLLVYLIIFIILGISSNVSANFVCGEVQDSEKVSASWFSVSAYYLEQPFEVTNCLVSPEDNRFCCDPEDIEEVQWAIGKKIEAEIFDKEKGYTTNPVSLIISGEGVDVFPELQLEEAISVYTPNSSIFHLEDLFLNVSIASRFNSLGYIINGSFGTRNSSVCNNCQQATFIIKDLPYGEHVLTLTASNENENISKELILTRTNNLSFSREIYCEGCEKNYVSTMKRTNIKVNLKSSENVTGILRDYFPVDWKFFQSDGVVEPFSETHNVINWNISGTNISREYTLISPRRIITRKYYFQSEFEDIRSEKDELILFRFYRFFAWPIKFLESRIERINFMNYASISPTSPLVMFFRDTTWVSVAIFPNTSVNNIHAYAQEINTPRFQKSKIPIAIHSNLGNNDIEKIMLRFKVRKPDYHYNLTSVFLYEYNQLNESWEIINVSEYKEDDSYIYYEGYALEKGIFTVKTEQERIKLW